MKQIMYVMILFSIILSLPGCIGDKKVITISISNDLPVARNFETVVIPRSQLPDISQQDFARLWVKDNQNNEVLVNQVIDEDSDGIPDAILFQPSLDANEEKHYSLFIPGADDVRPEPENSTFSRFVPERTDDYAWENDRVAFRTYGPTAQKMVEEGTPGGTLSSGMDCWLKRVEYPIINRWYEKYVEGTGSYHEDTGEGLDNFHVGASRGCGGTGIWDAEEKHLYTSGNFSDWKTIAEGPLRTTFRLDYEPWQAKALTIQEKKVISLDQGSNLTRYEVIISADEMPEQITAGITLHENDGNVEADPENGWFSYWQPHGDSELGMGIVVETLYIAGYSEHIVDETDMSHLFVHLKPIGGRIVYYAGFGWKKSGQFNSEQEWINYLQDYSKRVNSPLIVDITAEKGL